MKDTLNLLSSLASYFFVGKNQMPVWRRLMINLAAFLSFVVGYIIGCIALYRYLTPYWGDTFTLLVLGILFLTTGLVFAVVGWFLKPKPTASWDVLSKDNVIALTQTLNQIPNYEGMKKIFSAISPRAIVGIFVISAISSYFGTSKKKDT